MKATQTGGFFNIHIMKIKFIWDFKGEAGKPTADHHAIHLKDYIEKHQLLDCSSGVEQVSDMHSIAYLIADEKYLEKIKQELRPRRAVQA